jgi:hypothetical protein
VYVYEGGINWFKLRQKKDGHNLQKIYYSGESISWDFTEKQYPGLSENELIDKIVKFIIHWISKND